MQRLSLLLYKTHPSTATDQQNETKADITNIVKLSCNNIETIVGPDMLQTTMHGRTRVSLIAALSFEPVSFDATAVVASIQNTSKHSNRSAKRNKSRHSKYSETIVQQYRNYSGPRHAANNDAWTNTCTFDRCIIARTCVFRCNGCRCFYTKHIQAQQKISKTKQNQI